LRVFGQIVTHAVVVCSHCDLHGCMKQGTDVGEAGRCIHGGCDPCGTNLSLAPPLKCPFSFPFLPLCLSLSNPLSLLHIPLRMKSILIAVDEGTIWHQTLVPVCVRKCVQCWAVCKCVQVCAKSGSACVCASVCYVRQCASVCNVGQSLCVCKCALC
jgi:hypothetical protein